MNDVRREPFYTDLVSAMQYVYDGYGPEGVDTVTADIDGYGDEPPAETPWGEVQADGSRGHPDIDALREKITDPHLLDLIPATIICIDGQPAEGDNATLAQRKANIAKYQEMYWSNSAWGYIKVDDQGRHLPTDLYAGKPVQDDYFWAIAPCTMCYIWADPVAAPSTWKTSVEPTTGRVVQNLASFLEIARVYIEQWEAGNKV